MSLRARTVVYAFTITSALIENVLAFTAMARNNDFHLGPRFAYSLIAGIVGLFTWCWSLVLLFFNNRPASSSRLARCHAHFVSFTTFATAWLISAVLLSTRAPHNCLNIDDDHARRQCGLGAAATIFAWTTFLLCLTNLYLISRVATRSTAPLFRGLVINIAYYDSLPPLPAHHQHARGLSFGSQSQLSLAGLKPIAHKLHLVPSTSGRGDGHVQVIDSKRPWHFPPTHSRGASRETLIGLFSPSSGKGDSGHSNPTTPEPFLSPKKPFLE